MQFQQKRMRLHRVLMLLKYFYSQQGTSLVSIKDAIGLSGNVAVSIHPNSLGRVTITVKDQINTYPAKSLKNVLLQNGTVVKVASVTGDTLIVEEAN